jgi:hypothetical protein
MLPSIPERSQSPMNLKSVLQRLSRGQSCLWVGAGVGIQLGRASGGAVPGWDDLVGALEADARVSPPPGVPFAARLDVVLERLRRVRFQRELRERVLRPLGEAIVAAWRKHRKVVPQEVLTLAQLGFLANPIVNFNIETLSSEALVLGSGPWWPVVFSPPVPDSLSGPKSSRGSQDKQRHQRRVYHPHGALDISGVCVMTEREYRSMNGTLALQLAAHAAFGLDLVIVGMSLQDAYLREQLDAFRTQIRGIIWVTQPPIEPDVEAWCYRSQVEVIQTKWPEFWDAVQQDLPTPPAHHLAYEWLQLVQYAFACLGQPLTEMTNTIIGTGPGPVDPATMANWYWKASMHGEQPTYSPTALGAHASKVPDELTRDMMEVVASFP